MRSLSPTILYQPLVISVSTMRASRFSTFHRSYRATLPPPPRELFFPCRPLVPVLCRTKFNFHRKMKIDLLVSRGTPYPPASNRLVGRGRASFCEYPDGGGGAPRAHVRSMK